MLKAALYARVSTPHQEEEQTIESQIAAVENYARSHGYEIEADHYFLDAGVSGTQLDRPRLNRLRDLAASGLFASVLCLEPDRLSRQYAHLWVIQEELGRCGVNLVFVNQLADTKHPMGQILLGMQGLFAEYEHNQITQRLRRGLLHQVRQGKLVSPVPPYGYRYLPVSEAGGGCWTLHEQEAEIVRQIYAWYTQEEQTISQITDSLNQNLIQTPARGKRWNFSTVQLILKQPAYTGVTHYNRSRRVAESVGNAKKSGRGRRTSAQRVPRTHEEWIEVHVPRILPDILWQQAQERMQTNQRFAQRNNQKNFYLLRSLLVCDICGRTLVGRTAQGSVAYYCTNRGKLCDPDVLPHARSIAGRFIETPVWDAVVHLLNNPHLLADGWHDQSHSSPLKGEELDPLQAQLRKVERKWVQLLDLFQDELIDKVTLQQRKERLDSQRRLLEERIASLHLYTRRQQVKQQVMDNFTHFCTETLTQLDNATPQLRQEIIRLLVERIVVGADSITIHHIVPSDDDCRLTPDHR